MSVREYVGARYVPIFVGEWDNNRTYEPLMVVTYQGASYTSRQYVPAGIEITNESYWVLSANYNAQVEAYRKEVREILPYDETPTEGSAKGVTSDGIKKAIQTNETAIANEVTRAKEAEQTNADAIADEVTRAKEAEQTNATAIQTNETAIANEVTRATNAEQTNADAIQNLGFANPLYGVCFDGNDASANKWSYVASYDLSSIGTMGNLPSRGTSYDYSDASNLFELNGILYYPQQDHQDIYATRDGETWESGYGLNYPSPIINMQWAPMLFKDKVGNVKLAMARQYNSEVISNLDVSKTWNFRIDVFDCTVDSDGRITISDNYVTVLSNGTHIDPYIVYTEDYGYIMACKNENTCLIELYNGNSLTNLNLVGSLPYVGCEAPKFYIHGNDIALITQAYSLRTRPGTTKETAGHWVGKFYLSTHISLNPFSYNGMSVISCPSSYRHISLIMNSEVLSKYARKHGIVPYASSIANANRIIPLYIMGNDIYPAALPMKTVFTIGGGSRTITIHNATCGIQSSYIYITYIIGLTDHQPTITTENGKYTHVVKDGEVFPIFINSEGYVYFT